MLNLNQERYLSKLSENEKVVIKPFDLKLKEVAENVIESVHTIDPDLEVLFIGAAGLGISGQGDVDLYILCRLTEFGKFLPALKVVFGDPVKEKECYVAWEFVRDGVPVELYLADPNGEIYNTSVKEQIYIYKTLKNNSKLRSEYEDLKISLNGKSAREYQRRKFEFYNRILIQKVEKIQSSLRKRFKR